MHTVPESTVKEPLFWTLQMKTERLTQNAGTSKNLVEELQATKNVKTCVIQFGFAEGYVESIGFHKPMTSYIPIYLLKLVRFI